MIGRLRREGGQDLIEYALVLPVLALLLFGIMQFALIMFSYNTIANAAREGARRGSVLCSSFRPTCGATQFTEISTEATKLTIGLNKANMTITPTNPPGTVRVEVRYKVFLLPFFAGIVSSPSITLRAVSTMQTE